MTLPGNNQLRRECYVTIVQFNPLFKAYHFLFPNQAAYVCIIGFGDMLAWRQQIMSQLSIIGEQQQPFRILIEPAYREGREYLIFIRKQINHGSISGIFSSRDHSRRLMQHDVDEFPVKYSLPIYFNSIRMGVRLGSAIFQYLSVKRDSALFDHLFEICSGANPQMSQDLVYPLCLFSFIHRLRSTSSLQDIRS
ncbi:hypothetical protein D3C81_1560470 [compost metagenome]